MAKISLNESELKSIIENIISEILSEDSQNYTFKIYNQDGSLRKERSFLTGSDQEAISRVDDIVEYKVELFKDGKLIYQKEPESLEILNRNLNAKKAEEERKRKKEIETSKIEDRNAIINIMADKVKGGEVIKNTPYNIIIQNGPYFVESVRKYDVANYKGNTKYGNMRWEAYVGNSKGKWKYKNFSNKNEIIDYFK